MTGHASALNLVWVGPIYEASGYADEARGLLTALEAIGQPVVLRPVVERQIPGFREQLPERVAAALVAQEQRAPTPPFMLVEHFLADGFAPSPAAARVVGRTMFETDALPPSWVAKCNAMDALWVPSQFNVESFRRAGVTVPLHIVPGGVDSDRYSPNGPAMTIEGARGTVFLSVFEWRRRKGWDVLLRAWASAFSRDDNVCLVLRTFLPSRPASAPAPHDSATIDERIDRFLVESCSTTRDRCAPIIVLQELVREDAMPSLYRAANVYVSPTRGEGWGRPFMEAMATGLPVIATRWSAHLDFMNDENSLLLDINGLVPATDPDLSVYRGTSWAEPSVSHLVSLMQRVAHDPAQARAVGHTARQQMQQHWSWERAAQHVINAVLHETRSYTDARASTAPSAFVLNAPRAEGASDSLALTALRGPLHRALASHTINATTLTWCTANGPRELRAPDSGRWIVSLCDVEADLAELLDAPAFFEPLRARADELWVWHASSRERLERCGVTPERIAVIPQWPVLSDDTRTAMRSTAGVSVQPARLVVLPVADTDDRATADLVVRLWPSARTADATLRIVVDELAEASVRSWAEALARRAAATRALDSISIWIEPCTSHSMPALVRGACALLLPRVSARAMRWWSPLFELGGTLIAPDHPLTRDLSPTNVRVVQPGPNGIMHSGGMAEQLGRTLRANANANADAAAADASTSLTDLANCAEILAQHIVRRS